VRNGNNGGINLHNYNLLQNAYTAVPFGGVGSTGKATATNLRDFANDPAYFKASGNFTSLLNNYVTAGINTIRCNYPPSPGTTHALVFSYFMQGYNTVIYNKTIKFQNPPAGNTPTGPNDGGGNPPATGTKKIKNDANP